MNGFEPRTSGNGRDRSTNWATTTTLDIDLGISITQYCYLRGRLFVKYLVIYNNDILLKSQKIVKVGSSELGKSKLKNIFSERISEILWES